MISSTLKAISGSRDLIKGQPWLITKTLIASFVAAVCTSCYAALAGLISASISPETPASTNVPKWLIESPLAVDEVGHFVAVATLLALLLTVTLVRSAAAYIVRVTMATVEQNVIHHLRIRLFSHALALKPGAHSGDGAVEQGSQIIQEVKLVGQLVRLAYGQAFSQTFVIAALFATSLTIDPVVATITAAALILGLGAVRRPIRNSRIALRDAWKREASLHDEAAESLRHSALVKIYGAESSSQERFAAGSDQLRGELVSAVRIHARALPWLEVSMWSALLLGAVLAAWRWEDGVSSAPAYVALFTSMLLMIRPVRALAGLGHPLASGLAALDRMHELLSLPQEDAEIGQPTPDDPHAWAIHAGMVLGDPTPRLQGIDLELSKGESVAVVGASGAGKSTLLRTLLGLIPLDHGTLTVNGINHDQFSARAWRSMFSWVPQRPHVLHTSVLHNVALGDASPDVERAKQALKDSGAWQLVASLPDGIDEVIGAAKGRGISLGEAQRICLARALYRESPVLILDEPTSALDADAENAFLRTLTEVMKTRTVLISSHRKSVVLPVDRAVVLDGGRIVDDLSPHDLITQSGTYRSLVDRD